LNSDIPKAIICLALVFTFGASIGITDETAMENVILKENWEMVIKILENSSTKASDPITKLLLGHAYLATERYDKARLWFDSVEDEDDFSSWLEWNKSLLDRHPYNPIAIYLFADAMLRIGRIEKAIDGLKLALKKRPDFELASKALERISGLNDNYNRTIPDKSKNRKENLTDNRAYSKTSNVYDKKGDSGQNISDFTKSLENNGGHVESDFNRGKNHHQKGEYRLAVLDFTKTVELEKKHYQAYRSRGAAFHNLGEYDKAILDYTMALEINPEYPEAYNDRGVVFYDIGQIDEAISDFTKAIENDSSYINAYVNRGVIYMEILGEAEKGCADWNRACELGECKYYLIAKNQGDCQ